MQEKGKEKKFNMHGKDSIVLGYFIIYTHATHEKRRLDTILPIKKSLEIIHEKEEKGKASSS